MTKNDKTKGIPCKEVFPTYFKNNPNGPIPEHCFQQEDGSWEVCDNSKWPGQLLAVIEPDGTLRLTSLGDGGPTKLVTVRAFVAVTYLCWDQVTIQVPHNATRHEINDLEEEYSRSLIPGPDFDAKNTSNFERDSVEPAGFRFEQIANTGEPVVAVFHRDEFGTLTIVTEKDQ